MDLFIIAVLFSIAIFLALLPKGLFRSAKDKLVSYLGISPVELSAKAHIRSKNGILSQLMGLSKRFYYVLPIQLRKVRSAKATKLLQYAGIDKYGKEEIIGLRYLAMFAAFIYIIILYILAKDILLIFFGLFLSLICYWFPEKLLEIKAQKRMNNIQKAIPSMLTSGAIMLDAGMNIQQMLEGISEVSVNDLSKTIRLALHKAKMGASLTKALEDTLESCFVEEYRNFISIMIQGLEHGASGIAVIIRRLASESWDARKRMAQNLAQKASMKLFMPLVFLVLPAMLIFLMGPMAFYLGGIFK